MIYHEQDSANKQKQTKKKSQKDQNNKIYNMTEAGNQTHLQ